MLRMTETAEHSVTGHFPKLHDSGSTGEFKFIITQSLGPTLHDITRKCKYFSRVCFSLQSVLLDLGSAFTLSTALRVAIQMLRAIMNLHSLGFLHRSLRPQTFAIGSGSKIRTIFISDFGMPYMYRDPRTNKIRLVIILILN